MVRDCPTDLSKQVCTTLQQRAATLPSKSSQATEPNNRDCLGEGETISAFLKHAFREVTSGFCKGTVPGAPPRPSPGPLRMPKNNSKETYSVPPEGHLLVKNMWSDSQVVQRYRTRGAPFPVHKAPRMPKNISKKTYLVPGPKARLRQGTFEKPRQFMKHGGAEETN